MRSSDLSLRLLVTQQAASFMAPVIKRTGNACLTLYFVRLARPLTFEWDKPPFSVENLQLPIFSAAAVGTLSGVVNVILSKTRCKHTRALLQKIKAGS